MLRAKPYLVFSTSAKENFSWPEGFEYELDEEVEVLRRECQWALWSLTAECSRRNKTKANSLSASEFIKKTAECSRRNKTKANGLSASKFAEKIKENAVIIHKNNGPVHRQRYKVTKSRSFLMSLDGSIKSARQDRSRNRMFKEICWQVSQWTTMDLVLLLVASFGRMQLGEFDEREAVQAVEYMYKHSKDLNQKVCGLFEAVDITHGIQNSKQCVLYIYHG